MDTRRIIDQIYAAALDVTAWPAVMHALQQLFHGIAVGLYTADKSNGRVSLIEVRGVDPGYLERYIAEHLLDNPWAKAPQLQRQGHIRTDRSLDEHYNSPGFYHRTALYNEWMKPQEFIHTLGTNLLVADRAETKLFIYRPRQAGAFDTCEIARFEWLRGHLTQAVRVARRLAQQQAQVDTSLGALDRMDFGIAFLDAAGRVTHANRFAAALFRLRDGLFVSGGRLHAAHHEDGKRLTAALRSALNLQQGQTVAAPRHVSLRRPGGEQPLCVAVVPLPRRDSNPFLMEQPGAVLIVTDPGHAPAVPLEWLQQRYGLTPAEARLAQCLTQGLPLRQTAQHLGITYETARWYLKIVFQKTGTARQPDLVRRLLSERAIVRDEHAPALN